MTRCEANDAAGKHGSTAVAKGRSGLGSREVRVGLAGAYGLAAAVSLHPRYDLSSPPPAGLLIIPDSRKHRSSGTETRETINLVNIWTGGDLAARTHHDDERGRGRDCEPSSASKILPALTANSLSLDACPAAYFAAELWIRGNELPRKLFARRDPSFCVSSDVEG